MWCVWKHLSLCLWRILFRYFIVPFAVIVIDANMFGFVMCAHFFLFILSYTHEHWASRFSYLSAREQCEGVYTSAKYFMNDLIISLFFFCTSCEPHGMTIYWHIFLDLLNLWIWPFFLVLLCAYGVGIVLFCVFRLFFVLFSVV